MQKLAYLIGVANIPVTSTEVWAVRLALELLACMTRASVVTKLAV